MKSNLCLFVLSISFLLSQHASAQFYSLPANTGFVEGISDNGIAVGSFGSAEYFLWEVGVGGKVNIGGVPAGDGVGGQAKISNDGAFIGGTTFNNDSNLHEASRYEVATGMWTPLGGLGASSGSETSSGWNISGDGQSIVGLAWINGGTAHAASWRNGVTTDLGSTAGGQSTRANAVNFDGSVIAGWQDGNGRQGAVWVDGVQELIFDNGGNPAQESTDITDDGRFVTGFGTGNFVESGIPYRYDVENDTYLEIESLPVGGQQNSVANATTNDGSLIGGGTWPFAAPATFGNGFIWEEGVGTMSPQDYFASKGASGWPKGFNFRFVSAISSNGEWIAGWGGTSPVAATQSWVVRIPQVLVGDINLDGQVNLSDVAPFVELLSKGGFQAEGDINGDGEVNLLDVSPFVKLLAG